MTGSTRSRTLIAIGLAGLVLPAGAVIGTRLGDSTDAASARSSTTGPDTATAASGPRLILPDAAPVAGGEMRLGATGFPANVSGTLIMDGREVSTFTTTKGGRFSLTVAAPTTSRGNVRIEARAGSVSASALLELAPAVATADAVPAGAVVVMAVGDLTSSARDRENIAVRNIVRAQRPARILMLGDYQYQYGSGSAIRGGADKIWGPKPGGLWRRIMPTAGPTHDVASCRPSDYDRYWGRSAMKPYSFDLGSWHIIQLPSAVYRYNCSPAKVLAWLRTDLAQHPNRCTLAFWHEPYWTRRTDAHDRTTAVRPWVTLLYNNGVDVVLNGHQHNYQRFRPQNPSNRVDLRRGIRSFVVGSGGIGFYKFTGGPGNTASSSDSTYGALKLVLARGSYTWRFIRAGGTRFSDSGRATCH